MGEYTYIEILVEDESGRILVEQIMNKYVTQTSHTVWCDEP